MLDQFDVGDVRAILALMLTVACIGMTAAGLDVPDEMWAMTGLAVGFYFGSRGNEVAQRNGIERAQAEAEGAASPLARFEPTSAEAPPREFG